MPMFVKQLLLASLLLALPMEARADGPDRTWTRIKTFFGLHSADSSVGTEAKEAAALRRLDPAEVLETMIAAAEFPVEAEIYRAAGEAYLSGCATTAKPAATVMALARVLCNEFPESWDRRLRVLRVAFDELLARPDDEVELGLLAKTVRGLWLKDYPLHRFEAAKVESTLLAKVAAEIEADPGLGILLRGSHAVAGIPQRLMGYRNMYHGLQELLEACALVERHEGRRSIMEDFVRRASYCNYDKGGEDADFLVCAVGALQELPAAPDWRDLLALTRRLARLPFLPDRKAKTVLHMGLERMASFEAPADVARFCANADAKMGSWDRFDSDKALAHGLKVLDSLLGAD